MSRNVDERAVVMQFDNAQFEQGIAQSKKSLAEFEEKLQLKGASDAINKINKQFKNVDFGAIQDSLESIRDRFSSFGIAGMTVIQNLTNEVINFTKGALTNLYNKINTAGKARALKLENAHFLLQGILEDETAVQDALTRAKDSVDGTAYALDAASNAAATFVASGLTGDKLTNALNATANLTATVNGNYENISQIMVKIVGYGKLYRNELNQITNQGFKMNTYIAEYISRVNKGLVDDVPAAVKKNIKDMGLWGKKVIKETDLIASEKTGQLKDIMSETVIASINDKLGGMAQKANETFTGALENIGSAWARIGAMFWEPLVAQNSELVKFINVIRVNINAVKAGLAPFAKMVTDIILKLSEGGKVFGIFETSADGTERLAGSALHLTKLFESMFKIIEPLMEVFKIWISITNRLFGENFVSRLNAIIDAFANWVDKGSSATGISSDLIKKIYTMAEAFDKALKPVKDFWQMVRRAFYQVFDLKDNTDGIENFIDILTNLFNKMSEAYDRNDFKDSIFGSMVTIFESLKKIGTSIVKIVSAVGSAFSDIFIVEGTSNTKGFFEWLADILEKLANIVEIDDDTFNSLKETFKNIFSVARTLWGVIGQLLKVVIEALPQLMPFVTALLEATSGVIEWMANNINAEEAGKKFGEILKFLGTVIVTIIGAVSNAITKFKEWLEPIKDAIIQSGILTEIGGLLSDIFEKIKGALSGAGSEVSKFFESFKEGDMIDKFSEWLKSATEWIKNLRKSLGNFKIGEGFKGFIDFITGLFGGGGKSGGKTTGGAAKLGKGQMMKLDLQPLGDINKSINSIGGADTIKNITETLKSYIIPFLNIVSRVILAIIGLKVAKKIYTYIDFIAFLPKHLLDGAREWASIPKEFNKTLKEGMNKKFIVSLVTAIAVLVGALAVLIKVISSIPADRFGPTMFAFFGIFVIIIGGVVALLIYLEKMQKAMKGKTAGEQGKGLVLAKQMTSIAAMLTAIGAAMFLIALTFKVLATTFAAVKDPQQLAGVAFIMVSMLIILVALAVFLEEHAREMTASSYKPLMAIALVIGAIAGAMLLISKAFVMVAIVVAKLPLESVALVAAIFESILLTLALIVATLGVFGPKLTNAGPAIMGMAAVMAAIALVMIVFARSVQILVATLAELVALIMLTFGKDPGAFILAMQTLGIIAGVLAGGTALFMAVLGLLNMWGAGVDWKSLLGVGALMIAFALALKMVIGTLVELSAMLMILDQAKVEQAVWLMIGLMGGLGLVIGLLTLLVGISQPAGFALIALGAAFVSFGTAMFLVASAFAIFITAMSEFILLLETLNTLNSGGIASGIKNFFGSLADGIKGAIPEITNAIKAIFTGDKSVANLIVNGILTSVENNVNKIATTFGKIVDVMYDAIVKKEKKIDKIKEKITGFLQDILDNIGGLGIADLISKFLFGEDSDFDVKAAGLLGTLEEIFIRISTFLPEMLFNTITRLLELIGQNIETLRQFLIDRLLDVIEVIATVMENGTDRMVGALFYVLGALIHGLADFLVEHQEDILTILGAPFTWIAELLIRHREDILTALAAPIEWLGELLVRNHETILGVLGGITVIILEWLGILITELNKWWNENWPTIGEFVYNTFMDILNLGIQALLDGTETITAAAVELGFRIIMGILNGVAENIGDVADAAINVVETFRDEVVTEENINRVIDAGVGIIENFVNGIASWLEDDNNIENLRNSFIRLFNAILKAIRTFFGINDAGLAGSGSNLFTLAGNILKGLADGIKNAWETSPLKGAIDWLCKRFKGEMESKDKGFDVNSPSKWAEGLGTTIDEGLAIGVEKGGNKILKSVDGVTSDTKDAFAVLMESLKMAGDENFDINPVITPVVDTSNIESAAEMVNNAFGNTNQGFMMSYGLSSALAAGIAQNGGINSSNNSSNSSIVNFTQNNYSPKELSHYEVYRQTKNLLHTIDARS